MSSVATKSSIRTWIRIFFFLLMASTNVITRPQKYAPILKNMP